MVNAIVCVVGLVAVAWIVGHCITVLLQLEDPER